MTYQLGIAGCSGRMGRALLAELAGGYDDLVLAGAGARPGHESVGQPVKTLEPGLQDGPKISGDPANLFGTADVVIDFSSADCATLHAGLAARTGAALMVGTTGLSDEAIGALKAAADTAAILVAPNTSIGVNLLLSLTEEAARRLGPAFAISIHDLHHAGKKDAPSGTALALQRAAVRGRTQVDRTPGDIEITSERRGTVAGEHTVTFSGPMERIELMHRAEDRAVFAKGALMAAHWLAARGPGYYTMSDMLGLGETNEDASETT